MAVRLQGAGRRELLPASGKRWCGKGQGGAARGGGAATFPSTMSPTNMSPFGSATVPRPVGDAAFAPAGSVEPPRRRSGLRAPTFPQPAPLHTAQAGRPATLHRHCASTQCRAPEQSRQLRCPTSSHLGGHPRRAHPPRARHNSAAAALAQDPPQAHMPWGALKRLWSWRPGGARTVGSCSFPPRGRERS